MRKYYNSNKIKFYIGDVRDYASVLSAMRGVDYVFHAAALKQVPSCEFFPLQATKTNVIGTENVLESAIVCNVQRVICLSTDKAVYPINAMGISKALMEKVAIAKSRISNSTSISIVRYGNVMASRGSVIPLFVDQILEGKPITITDPKMTRFMMTLDDAVDLVLFAFANGEPGEIFIQKSPSASIEILVQALLDLMSIDLSQYEVNVIGTRHGEKLYEALLSREEMVSAEDMGDYFKIAPDLRDLNYGSYIDKGEKEISNSEDYNSHNTKRLNVDEMKSLLMKLAFVQSAVKGEYLQPEK
jgi:UDP-N-acetylglucosamine 4,6-dehydratase/5-epimerase